MGFMKPKSQPRPEPTRAPEIPDTSKVAADGADRAAERANSEIARRVRNRLKIPLSSAVEGGSGIFIPT